MARLRTSIGITLLFLARIPLLSGCGIDWGTPVSRVENVDFQGHPHVVETLETLKLSDGLSIPIYLIFNSSYGPSQYTGAFEIPILQSKMVQIDENTFLLRSPAGWLLPFRRTQNNSILEGRNGMKAEIKGDSITAWGTCGDKLTFIRGKIVEVRLKDVVLSYSYSGDKVTEIRDQLGHTILKVDLDPSGSGRLNRLQLPDNKTIEFSWGTRPIVQKIQNTPLVVESQDTIVGVSKNGVSSTFEFGLDEQLTPSMTFGDGQCIKWDAGSGFVKQIGDWSYQITPGAERWSYAAISRENPPGGKEFWHLDAKRGVEIEQGSHGVRKTSWFTSGKLAGKLRSIETSQNGETQTELAVTYDQDGNVIREIAGPAQRYYSSATAFETKIEGITTRSSKTEKGRSSTTFLPGGQRVIREFNGDGLLVNVCVKPATN